MDSGDMPRDDDDRAEDLHALFERARPHVDERPFVGDVARRVAAARRRGTVARRAAEALVVGALIAASPWLVSGSALLSAKLALLFSAAASALDSPFGYGAGLLCFLAAALVFRRRLFG